MNLDPVTPPQAAVFWDFDNMHFACASKAPSFPAQQSYMPIHSIMHALTPSRVIWNEAFGDFSQRHAYARVIMQLGMQLRQVFTSGAGRNGTDLTMAVAVLRFVSAHPTVRSIALCTGDSDFVALVAELRRQGIHVTIVSYKCSLGRNLALCADRVVIVDDITMVDADKVIKVPAQVPYAAPKPPPAVGVDAAILTVKPNTGGLVGGAKPASLGPFLDTLVNELNAPLAGLPPAAPFVPPVPPEFTPPAPLVESPAVEATTPPVVLDTVAGVLSTCTLLPQARSAAWYFIRTNLMSPHCVLSPCMRSFLEEFIAHFDQNETVGLPTWLLRIGRRPAFKEISSCAAATADTNGRARNATDNILPLIGNVLRLIGLLEVRTRTNRMYGLNRTLTVDRCMERLYLLAHYP